MSLCVNLVALEKALAEETVIYLATSQNDYVTARPISHINVGLTVYVRTADDSLKAKQMHANANVAICVGSVFQLEGKARFIGDPHSAGNKELKTRYMEKYPGAFTAEDENDVPQNQFIAIDLSRVRQWHYEDPQNSGLAEINLE